MSNTTTVQALYDYLDTCPLLTGKGEKGQVSISIESDLTGVAGENATFSATLTSVGVPEEYTYSPSTGG